MKIWMKNFFYTTLIVILISFISLASLYFFMPKYYETKLEKEATESITDIVTSYQGEDINKIKKNVQTIDDYKYGYTLLDSNNKKIAQSLSTMSVETFGEAEIISSSTNEEFMTSLNKEKENEFLTQIITVKKTFIASNSKKYTLVAEIFSQPITDASAILLELSPYIVLISLILGLIVAFFYSKFSTKRIILVSESTRKMVRSNENCIIEISGNDEISDLANDINYLNNELKQTIHSLELEIKKVAAMEKSKQYFVQSAAHELKTPLSIMSGLIEGMQLNIGKYQDHDTYLKKCQELITKQTELIAEITAIYQLTDEENEQISLAPIAINKLIERCVAPYLLIAEQSGKSFQLNLSDTTELAHQEDLERLLSNVIGNAFRYSTDNTLILINYTPGKIMIENKCTPLSEDELNHVFEAFYRPDFSRNSRDGGTGLGLFFVKELADKYDYPFEFVPNKQNDGMIFTLYFY